MIRVDKDFIIKGSSCDYAALRDQGTVTDKNGKETMKTDLVGYYGTVEDCLRGILKYAIREKVRLNDYTLQEVVKEIQATNEYFVNCYKQLDVDFKEVN